MTEARDGYEPIVREALRLYIPEGLAGTKIREGWRDVAHLAHGWYQRCHRGLEALLLLDAAGYAEEASPLRRSIIEHVVALQWLAVEGDQILDTVARAHASSLRKVRDAVSAANWTSYSVDEANAAISSAAADERDPTNDYLQKFAHRASRYSSGHVMAEYLLECSRSHPCYDSAICYTDTATKTFLGSSAVTVPQIPFAATHVLMALEGIRDIFVPRPWAPEMTDLISRYRTVTDTVRSEDGFPPFDWPPLPDF